MKVKRRISRCSKGFSLIEVLLGIALMGIAMLGLAQMFVMSVWSNHYSEQISTATFLAQQEIDYVRTLTSAELQALQTNYVDENLDVNNDGVTDYRRITQISSPQQSLWTARVLVFPISMINMQANALFNNPLTYHVLSDMYTNIYR